MKVIDLFCGAGGFSEGLRQSGFDIVLGIDNWDGALESFRMNFPKAETICMDILYLEKDELPEADVLIGSPPCQEFSPLGIKKGNDADTKCLKKFLELGKQFKYVIGENVPNIKPYINGIHSQTLRACQFGLWHRRDRLFFGRFPRVKPKTRNKIVFPTPTTANNVLRNFQNELPNFKRKDMWRGNAGYPINVAKWIMGFPDDYIFFGNQTEQHKQIGNAVCPPVSKAIGESILKSEEKGA